MSGFQSIRIFFTPYWSEEIFFIKQIKNTIPWTYVISDLNGEEIIGSFY